MSDDAWTTLEHKPPESTKSGAPEVAVSVHRPRPRAGLLGLLGLGRAGVALAHRRRQQESPRARPRAPCAPPAQPSTLSRGSPGTPTPSPRPAPWRPGTLRRGGTAGPARGAPGAGTCTATARTEDVSQVLMCYVLGFSGAEHFQHD